MSLSAIGFETSIESWLAGAGPAGAEVDLQRKDVGRAFVGVVIIGPAPSAVGFGATPS